MAFLPRNVPCLLLLATLLVSGVDAFAQSSAQVAIDAHQVVRTIDERVFGVNAAIWDSSFGDPQTLSLLQAADVRTLRFPGGSLSDTYDWKSNKSYDATTGVLNSWSWATSFDAFAAVAKPLQAQVFITVNYGSGSVQDAADWVTYSNVTKNYGFKYWEVGNENYGSWEYDTHAIKWDPVTYATEAKNYIAAMKAADPTIKVGVVVQTGEDDLDAKSPVHPVVNPRTGATHHGWTAVMLSTLKSLGVTPDFVIYHRYPQAPFAESDAGLLAGRSLSGTTWADDAANLRQMVDDYLGAVEGAKVELVVTENNSVYSDPGKQSTSLVNGLFMADSLGQVLQTEFNALVWWALRNGPPLDGAGNPTGNFSASLYGWRNYGDYGMLSPAGSANPPTPNYYVMKLLSHFARAGDQVVKATSDNPLLATYAVKRANGTLSLLVINKSPTLTTTAHVALNGFSPAPIAPVYGYGKPQDDAARTGVGLADITLSGLSGLGTSFSAPFQPYSASVITLYPAGVNSRIVNLSVRAVAGSADRTLIVGFVVGGGGAGKTLPVLLRGKGPTLTDFGVANVLADPALTLHQTVDGLDTTPIANDDWNNDPQLAELFSLFAGSTLESPLEAAFATSLGSSPYTVHLTGKEGGAGVALAELFDVAVNPAADTPRLVNISGRTQVNTGEDALIAGFVVNGNGPKRVLIRGLGPGLSPDVNGVLANPRLDLHTLLRGKDATLASNTAWGGSAELVALFKTVGADPTLEDTPNSKDTVLDVTLAPGIYTAVISGVGGTTGVALVEIYEVE